MSRSYKKFPFCKDAESSKWGKQLCNRHIRRHKNELPNKGNLHKRLNERWDFIYDYSSRMTWEEYAKWCKQGPFGREPIKADYNDWCKWYKRK